MVPAGNVSELQHVEVIHMHTHTYIQFRTAVSLLVGTGNTSSFPLLAAGTTLSSL